MVKPTLLLLAVVSVLGLSACTAVPDVAAAPEPTNAVPNRMEDRATEFVPIAVVESYIGIPQGIEYRVPSDREPIPLDEVAAQVDRIFTNPDQPDYWAVATIGSSSCPRIPVRFGILDNGRLEVITGYEESPETNPPRVCTLDLGPTTFIVEALPGYRAAQIEGVDGYVAQLTSDVRFQLFRE